MIIRARSVLTVRHEGTKVKSLKLKRGRRMRVQRKRFDIERIEEFL